MPAFGDPASLRTQAETMAVDSLRTWTRLTSFYRYLGAALLGAAAVMLRMAFRPMVGMENPYTTFYFAVALSTWLFESGPGLLCFAVCAGSAVYLLLDPILPLRMADRGEQINFALFTLSALGIWLIVTKLKSTQKQLKITFDRLAASEREARAANQAKDEFLAMVSHELRNPLNSLALSASLLTAGGENQEQNARSIAVINRAAQKLAGMVDDLVDSARIATGRLAIERQSLDLLAVVRAAIDLMAPSAQAKGIGLTARIDAHRAIVSGDRDRLQECILNLIGNAIKFTAHGGTIEVAAHNGGGYAELRVSDTGDGIDGDFLPHVFERFAQGGALSRDRRGGLGLGLFIVRHVIEAHGGKIAVSSAGRDLGATFTVTLPLVD
jgi:signal transduction histidine kinase